MGPGVQRMEEFEGLNVSPEQAFCSYSDDTLPVIPAILCQFLPGAGTCCLNSRYIGASYDL